MLYELKPVCLCNAAELHGRHGVGATGVLSMNRDDVIRLAQRSGLRYYEERGVPIVHLDYSTRASIYDFFDAAYEAGVADERARAAIAKAGSVA